MNLTENLKAFLVKECGVEKDASDEKFRAAAGTALADPEKSGLTIEKFQELTTDPAASEANEFLMAQQKTNSLLESTIELLKGNAAGGDGASADGTTTDPKDGKTDDGKNIGKETKSGDDKTPSVTKLQESILAIGGTETEPGMKQAIDIRVKEAADQYPNSKKGMVYGALTAKGQPHRLAGQPVMNMGQPMQSSSDLDKALAGVYAKWQLLALSPQEGTPMTGSPQLAWERLSAHERELMCYLTTEGMWDSSKQDRLSSIKGYRGGHKALIDDALSGGLEAAPIVFDDMIIEVPLLWGELFPLVNEKPLDRGRRIEGVAIGRVTGTWGGVDDTAVALFDTTAYVTAFDTTIFRWEGAITIGLDFLSDTPIDFGSEITRQYGERLLEDLDDVIATGDGTTQPEGIINKAGVSLIAFGGATTIGNYEALRFGVAKPEHRGPVASSAVYCGTETSFSRMHGIPVGATDARRIFGIDHFGPDAGGYVIGTGSYRINESLTNEQIFYAVLARYRMYRRKGFTVRTSTEGDTLIRDNSMLIVVMSRYGGQLERGGAAAITTTAPV